MRRLPLLPDRLPGRHRDHGGSHASGRGGTRTYPRRHRQNLRMRAPAAADRTGTGTHSHRRRRYPRDPLGVAGRKRRRHARRYVAHAAPERGQSHLQPPLHTGHGFGRRRSDHPHRRQKGDVLRFGGQQSPLGRGLPRREPRRGVDRQRRVPQHLPRRHGGPYGTSRPETAADLLPQRRLGPFAGPPAGHLGQQAVRVHLQRRRQRSPYHEGVRNLDSRRQLGPRPLPRLRRKRPVAHEQRLRDESLGLRSVDGDGRLFAVGHQIGQFGAGGFPHRPADSQSGRMVEHEGHRHGRACRSTRRAGSSTTHTATLQNTISYNPQNNRHP